MDKNLQSVADFIQQNSNIPDEQKESVLKSLKAADKELQILSFKLDRTEKVKRTTAILLEETIEELELKRKAVEETNEALQKSLKDLKAAQNQLVQQEKLASLGQLTAGIAHEIKNPLNFVNNFSELSIELIEEARDEIKSVGALHDTPPQGDLLVELNDILNDVEMNLQKIHEHGSRADGIVTSMLEHSRGGSGEMVATPFNQLIKEYVNLAFHGMRASKQPINVDFDMQLDESLGTVPLVVEDFSRVIVNLCNNAFDAMRERLSADNRQQSDKTENHYEPRLTVKTYSKDSNIILEIEDNGPGIPEEMKDKIMQPFFTTKKGTEGTGLGLSITNDIIKAHGGTIEVYSKPGQTIFKIKLFG
ncbi:GHKL domain-containing protein [Balneolaceae bacterium YR4-1]|uniref:histidine kinase n=1 Tax=Halalkalibaculum roseum TaxID=2709311 RepID=A0A6M1SYZ2_9BACT|nr:ATP-binding protein [Halalkalibaculum roseum]NGP75075.1 GHKL domain-containing protein [Halalkalibaculum roseum]